MVKFQLTFILFFLYNIMDVKIIEQGRFSSEIVDFSVSRIIKDVTKVFKFQAARQSIKIMIELVPYLDWSMNRERLVGKKQEECTLPDLNGDERRLKQVLMNLLQNAMKAVRRGDKILIIASYN